VRFTTRIEIIGGVHRGKAAYMAGTLKTQHPLATKIFVRIPGVAMLQVVEIAHVQEAEQLDLFTKGA
jgi:hypothetical protein